MVTYIHVLFRFLSAVVQKTSSTHSFYTTLTLTQHFPPLPGEKKKEIYRRWKRERSKLLNFWQFSLKSLNSFAKTDRGRSVLTERGNNWYAAGKLVTTISTRWLCCYPLILQCLFPLPPQPYKWFFQLFHITVQTYFNLHNFKMRFSLSLQLVPSAITFSPSSLSFLNLLPTSSEPGVCPLWHPSLICISQPDYPVCCYYSISAVIVHKLPVELLAPHFCPQTALWKMNKPFILQSLYVEFPQNRHIPIYSHI